MASPLDQQFGTWAIITGASAGIGEQFARDLASKGINLILVSRRETTLKELALELERTHGIETRVTAADLSEPGFAAELDRTTSDLDVGIVISNAGAAAMGAALRVPLEQLQAMLRLNTAAHLELAHVFGNRFLVRGRGGIVLVGSTAGLQATPYAGNYSGSKAYLHAFGSAMNFELRDTDIHVTVLAPGPTRTPALSERTDIDLGSFPAPTMSTEKLVKIGLTGLAKNKPLVVAGAPNRMMDWMGRKLLGHRGSRKMWGTLMESGAPDHLKIAT